MPEQTYNIGYGINDFFYNSENVDLQNSLPFDKYNLVTWANSNGAEYSSIPINIFDPKISAVVILKKDNFIKNYLPGNIVINQNFSNFSNFGSFKTELDASTLNDKNITSQLQSGNITIKSSITNLPETTFDLSVDEDTNLNYKMNGITLGDEITFNGNVNYGQIPYNEPNGSTSYISVNTSNPRCKYQNNCTITHWHYASCTTQTFVNNDGQSYCKCVCKGPKEKNSNPHSHCSPYNISDTNDNGNPNPDAIKSSLASLINKISFSIKKTPYSTTSTGNTLEYEYTNGKDFIDTDENIRTKLYDYYYELNRNILLRSKIISNDSADNTASQALLDANVKYKKEYLHLFNIFSGILFVSGYIYVMYK